MHRLEGPSGMFWKDYLTRSLTVFSLVDLTQVARLYASPDIFFHPIPHKKFQQLVISAPKAIMLPDSGVSWERSKMFGISVSGTVYFSFSNFRRSVPSHTLRRATSSNRRSRVSLDNASTSLRLLPGLWFTSKSNCCSSLILLRASLSPLLALKGRLSLFQKIVSVGING